ncbi:hypothetical protein BsWGS_28495 [Bradybaena similaris]
MSVSAATVVHLPSDCMSDDTKIWLEWKKQLTAYVAWVNSQLKKKPGAHLVEDLRHDVRDGVALADLIQVIAGEVLPDIHQAPSSHAEMRGNVDKVLQFMAARKVKMHHITTRDIVDGNLKAIMRLILALAAHYKPNSVRHSAQSSRQNITGIAQGAAAALTEARRNATRAGHRYRRRRPKEDVTKQSERKVTSEEQRGRRGRQTDMNDRLDEDRTSDNSSPVSSQNASPRASLYLSDPPSSMEGLLSVSGAMHRGGIMVTSCESDSAMGDSGYSEICDCLKETHEVLFQLHELLLTGDSSGDAKTLPRGDLEGANSRETIIILKSRLLHAEEVAESLRADLIRAKRDCLELQGTKAGLQQRLKEEESTLSELKSEVMTLELEKDKLISEIETLQKQLAARDQVLSDVKMSCAKQIEDKDRAAADLKRELMKRDHTIHQLQEQISQMKESVTTFKQATEPMVHSVGDETKVSTTEVSWQGEPSVYDQRLCVLTDCLHKLTGHDKAADLKASELETAKDTILQSRAEVRAQHPSSAVVDHLEDTVVRLLDRLHINGSSTGCTAPSRSLTSSNKNVTPSRRLVAAPQSWRSPASKDTPKAAARGRVQGLPASCASPGRGSLRNTSQHTQASGTRGQSAAARGCGAGRGVSGVAKVARSQIPRPQDAQTNVLYYVDQSEKALSCVINKQLGDIRLRDFKAVIEDSNLYHYFFKALDPEYGTVKEELFSDDDILPGWEGKIVAWLELETGPSC